MSDYCKLHSCNNCIECAIDKQTKEIVKAIEALRQKSIMSKLKRFLKL